MIVQLDSDSVAAQAEHCQRLAYVLGMTTDMLAHADRGEWDKVAAMEQERREDLIACFADARPDGDSELVAQALATLLHLNEELMSKLRAARSEVVAQGEALSLNRSAHATYQSVEASI